MKKNNENVKINKMCNTCQKLNKDCKGMAIFYSDCIYYKKKKMLKLTELREGGEVGEEKIGTLDEIVDFLKENKDLYDWILAEDPNFELPNFDDIEVLRDLKHELDKVDLSWWSLNIREL